MTDDIIEGYLRELEAALAAEDDRKRQIVDEIRSHLEEKVADLAARHPEKDAEALTRQVIHDFGNPHDLALAYRDEGPVITNRAGDVVLRLSRAVGRGTRAVIERAQQDDVKRALHGARSGTGRALDAGRAGLRRAGASLGRGMERTREASPHVARAFGRGMRRAAKWTGVTLLVVLVVGLVLGLIAFNTVLPVVAKSVPYPLYSARQYCDDANCTMTPVTQRFFVHPGAQEVRMGLDAWTPVSGNGTAWVTVRTPGGEEVYNRTLGPGASGRVDEEIGFPATPGNWTAVTEFEEYRGWFHVRIEAVGLPEGRLWFP